jgi:adhesin HecA-like repeat protein
MDDRQQALRAAHGLDVRDGTVKAEGDLDFRGTLGAAAPISQIDPIYRP